jgi:UPF0716 protein FxsA
LLRHLPTFIFIVFILELASLIWLGRQVGILPVLGVTVLDVMIGTSLIRRSGTSIFTAMNTRSFDAKAVSNGAAHGMLGTLSGILFIIPGLFSDVLALFMLLPWLRKRLAKFMEGHIVTSNAYPGSSRGPVIDGEVVDVEIIDPPRLDQR